MAFQHHQDDLDLASGHYSISHVMEPEAVVPTSDDETQGTPSTPGSKGRMLTAGSDSVTMSASSSQGLGLGVEGIALSAADKKRNKLGYHRSAVACGHCRRRKIRCILAPDDANGRCQNCIRLRKECQFFPVDQQNMTSARRGRSGSKADSALTDPDMSASSSEPGVPAILKSSTDEQVEQANGPLLGTSSPSTHGRSHQMDANDPRDYENFNRPFERPDPRLPNNIIRANSFQSPHFDPSTASPHLQTLYNYHNTGMSPSMGASAHSPSYMLHRSDQGMGFGTQNQGRDVSGSEQQLEPHTGYRAQVQQPLARRQSAPQQVAYGEPIHAYTGRGTYDLQATRSDYQDPSHFDQLSWTQHSSQPVPQMPTGTTASYSGSWYTPHLTYVREEEEAMAANLHGHAHFAYGPGPG